MWEHWTQHHCSYPNQPTDFNLEVLKATFQIYLPTSDPSTGFVFSTFGAVLFTSFGNRNKTIVFFEAGILVSHRCYWGWFKVIVKNFETELLESLLLSRYNILIKTYPCPFRHTTLFSASWILSEIELLCNRLSLLFPWVSKVRIAAP